MYIIPHQSFKGTVNKSQHTVNRCLPNKASYTEKVIKQCILFFNVHVFLSDSHGLSDAQSQRLAYGSTNPGACTLAVLNIMHQMQFMPIYRTPLDS